jgi:acyl CoA:acetate/3-ketoacid CoA transferase beta subunit
MTSAREIADRMTWSLARQCRPDDVMIVGVATPLAAAAGLVARELLVPDLTIIMAAAVNPKAHDVAQSFFDPTTTARHAPGVMSQPDMLDAIHRGHVTLMFVSPAEVDARGQINTSRILGRDGLVRRLPGAFALPDVAVLMGRLVAYRTDHSPRFLVPEVQYTTGAGNELDRSGAAGSGVTTIITGQAEIALASDGSRPELAMLQPGAKLEHAIAGCGFPLTVPDQIPVAEPMPPEARALLDEIIDPHEIRLLEVREGRAAALDRLLARPGGNASNPSISVH